MNLNKNQPSKVLFGDNQLEVSNNCQYTYQDKPNAHQVIEYLGEIITIMPKTRVAIPATRPMLPLMTLMIDMSYHLLSL